MAGTFAAWRLGTLQARALPLARELRAHGVRCAIVTVPWDMPAESGVKDTIAGVDLHNTTQAAVATFPLAVYQQMRQIQALDPRAVHVFKPKGYGGLSGQLLARNIPLLVDSDDWEGDGGWNQAGNYSRLQRRLFQWQERRLLRTADAVTAASHLLARRATALRPASPDTVSWVPNGLEPGWARRLSESRASAVGADLGTLRIVLYSRFAEFPDDWLSRYLKTLSNTLPEGALATITIVGDSPESHTGFDNLNIDQMGYVALERIPEILGRAHSAIYPYTDSLISRSKNSVKLLELMAAGCAVIASNTGDVPAVTGETAVLIEGSNPAAFATETVNLWHNPERLRWLSSSAQHRALNQFCLPNVTRLLLAAYRNAGVLPLCSHA